MNIHEIRLQNLEKLIEKHGSAAKIASKIGSAPSVFSVIRSDKHPHKNMGSGMARRIEVALGLHEGWMDQRHDVIQEHSYDHNAEILSNIKKVPIISMVAAGDWTEAYDPYAVGMGDGYEECDKCSDNAFAVRVSGESMAPRFKSGDVLICDPNVIPENKDLVIAKLTDTNEATFKQLVIEDGHKILKALNPDWPRQYIPINGNCLIIGKVIKVTLNL